MRATPDGDTITAMKMTESELRALAKSADAGDAGARERLFAALYDELHRIARHELQRNGAITLSPTTLLHETYLNLSSGHSQAAADRARFIGYAASAMRGLLIDHLHARQSQGHGGRPELTSIPLDLPNGVEGLDAQKLGSALDELARTDPRLAECVDLKFFCGLSYGEIAKLWDVSERTVQREWEKARVLLHRMLSDSTVL